LGFYKPKDGDCSRQIDLKQNPNPNEGGGY
jgi:hypothetical protein